MGADDEARRREVGAGALSLRVVGVLPDVPAIDKIFDYAVPAAMDDDVRLGTVVRVVLHGRRVGGWVVREGAAVDVAAKLLPLAKVTGWGPPPEVLALARWAAWRWAGRMASVLVTATAPHAVRGLPAPGLPSPPAVGVVDGDMGPMVDEALSGTGVAVLRLPPATDPFPLVLAATQLGPALVLYPSVDAAAHAALRLRRAGVAVASHPREWATARAGRGERRRCSSGGLGPDARPRRRRRGRRPRRGLPGGAGADLARP